MRTKLAQQRHDKKVAEHNRKRKAERKLSRTMDPKAWAYRKQELQRKQQEQGKGHGKTA